MEPKNWGDVDWGFVFCFNVFSFFWFWGFVRCFSCWLFFWRANNVLFGLWGVLGGWDMVLGCAWGWFCDVLCFCFFNVWVWGWSWICLILGYSDIFWFSGVSGGFCLVGKNVLLCPSVFELLFGFRHICLLMFFRPHLVFNISIKANICKVTEANPTSWPAQENQTYLVFDVLVGCSPPLRLKNISSHRASRASSVACACAQVWLFGRMPGSLGQQLWAQDL